MNSVPGLSLKSTPSGPSDYFGGDFGVGPDQAHVRAVLLESFEGALHPALLWVAEEVGEEHIGPGAFAAGAALDAGKVDPLFRESRERVLENAGAVFDREHDAGLVLACTRGPGASEHDKARGVRAGVLDVARQDRQTVGAGGQDATDRGHSGLHRRATGR